MDVQDTLSDDEDIYRRVRNNPDLFRVVDGKVLFSSSAFNDPGQKPSVDRAKLRTSAEESKRDSSDGIVSLKVLEVRQITSIKIDEKAEKTYAVDVLARPVHKDNPEGLPENLAHAQIETNPGLSTGGRFRKLKEALAIIATKNGWLLSPTTPDSENKSS